MMFRELFGILGFVLVAMGCQHATKSTQSSQVDSADDLAPLSISSLPEWTDRYADGKKGDVRFFRISALMSAYQLTRVQAIELQNQYRDLTRKDVTMTGQPAFERALSAVRADQFESKLDVTALETAKFVVVFDLDDTLFDQYYSGGETCNTHAFEEPDGTMKYVHMVPGWAVVIKRIISLGGRVVIFSANLDDRTRRLLSHVKLDDVPLTDSKLISGIMTNSYLIQQEKTEPPGSHDKPRRGRPVLEPSKDMRFFDESLQKVIIVDDNPLRLFQFRNVRVYKKFHADEYCTATDPVEKRAIEGGMRQIAEEIEWAVRQMNKDKGLPFAQAYLPFSVLGQVTVSWLMHSQGWDAETAWLHIVKHPTLVDKRF